MAKDTTTSEETDFTDSPEALLDLLAFLRALYMVHQNAHWSVAGDNSYGDHLMFQRLYESVSDEVDVLAEKIIGTYGSETITTQDQVERILSFTGDWEGLDLIDRALASEEELQDLLDLVYEYLEEEDDLSLGMDDYLAATASAHETNLFLLRQRTKES